MRVVTFQDIVNYSICPNLAKYSKNNSKDFYVQGSEFNFLTKTKLSVIEDSIKRIIVEYGRAITNEEILDWDMCRQAVILIARRYLLPIKTAESKLSKRELIIYYNRLKKILNIIQNWYSNFFVKTIEKFPHIYSFTNFPFRLCLGTNFEIRDFFDIITTGDLNIISDIQQSDINYTSEILYNDIIAHMKLWCYSKVIGTIPQYYHRTILHDSKLSYYKLYTDHTILNKIEKIINYVCRGLSENLYFPVHSNLCTTCKYSTICHY